MEFVLNGFRAIDLTSATPASYRALADTIVASPRVAGWAARRMSAQEWTAFQVSLPAALFALHSLTRT